MIWVLLSLPLLFSSPKKLACEAENKTLKAGDKEVRIETYKSASSGNHIVIFPPTGGKNALDQYYARDFCRAGRSAIIMEDWTGYRTEKTDLGVHNRYYRAAVDALKLVQTQVIGKKSFGVMGTSLGGIFTAVSLHQIPEIDQALIIASGIDLPEMIVTSGHRNMKALKKLRYQKYSFQSDEEYIKVLRKEIPLEPTINPIDFNSKKLGVYVVKGDQIVPEKNQRKLAQLWNPELQRTLDANWISKLNGRKHKSGIIKAYFHYSQEVIAFFVR